MFLRASPSRGFLPVRLKPLESTEPLAVHWVNQYAATPDQPGGTRHFDMATELRRHGLDVRIVSSDLNLTTRSYGRRRHRWSLRRIDEQVGNVPFSFLPAGSYSANDWRRVASMAVFSVTVFVHLLRLRARRRLVVIGSSPHLPGAFAAWAAARLRRLPFVLEVRDLWPESYAAMTRRLRGAEIGAMRTIADLLYRRSEAVVVFTSANRDHVIGRGANPTAVHVIPNGVDLDQFDTPSALSKSLGRPGVFTFVYAGAHGPANGLEAVLDACAILQQRDRSGLRVVLLGDGPAKNDLMADAARRGLTNVEFHDPVGKEDVPAALRTADAGLMILAPVDLFSYGVSPNKLFDYLAADLPVITNVPGLVSDIVDASRAGLTVPPGDPEALANAMVRLADEQAVPDTRRPSGRPYVAEHYDRKRLAAQLRGVLESVAPAP